MFVGIDHSTTAVKACVLDPDGGTETFAIERSRGDGGPWSFLDQLSAHVDPAAVDMAAYGYCYGDRLRRVKDIEATTDRGIVDNLGLGQEVGTGTDVYDALVAADLPCVAFPGVHDGLDTLHEYFRHYSTLTGADKLAMTRYAHEQAAGDTYVAACASSSAMATLVVDGRLRGAFHWIGLVHGWPDVCELRAIRDGETTLDDLLLRMGFLEGAFEEAKGTPDPDLLEKVYQATLHNVYGLAPFAAHVDGDGLDEIVLSGRLSRVEDPVDVRSRLESACSGLAPTTFAERHSAALGAAYIARDVYRGADSVLGIPVGTVPKTRASTA
ncbi:hypothetical protein BRC81_05080 [Halobacteriales archaeon QS_1_68_20]|nr:MAG: hypothetical protein BRC81_05080 [Halobacteriales archaeon QS_1_68_20]